MSRVFLSYSRTDEDFATLLRKRLEVEAPDVSLWQDRTHMEGGVGWWQQVRDALDQVEFMVLVMSEATLRSETVRKEWRYARQQGVCVYPVQAGPFDFAELPRWMSNAHFFDLQKEWPTFVQYLRSPAYPRRVPFMAPDLPVNFVRRPVELKSLQDHLLEHRQGNSVAITTALYGAGGFGKTTLAAALCHDEDVIAAYFDGILWVTLGRNPNLQAAVTLLYNALAGEHAAFLDVQAAGLSLAGQIQDRTCLLVIDDVWDPSHLQPFLRAGPNCARLITTRDFRIAADFVQVKVDEMCGTEATQLLCRGIPYSSFQPFEETARRLGEWPLLLELANATLRHRVARGDTVDGALSYLNRALERRGVTRFDPLNEAKIARTIEISLESLHQGRQQYFELAVFPENTDVPMAVVQGLWGRDDFETEELLQSMHDLSLLRFDLQAGTFRLHDAIRTWIREQLPDPTTLHSKLMAAWGNLRSLPHTYAWRWIGYHLSQARQIQILRSLLLDFGWLRSKLEATDVNALIVDCEHLKDDPEISRIQSAIRLSAHVLARDKTQFAGQLLGRLTPGASPSLTSLLDEAARWRGTSWLRPLRPTLTQAGGPLLRTIPVGNFSGAHLVLSSDGSRAFCTSYDGAIQEWDLGSGTRVRSLNRLPAPVNAISLVGPGLAAIAVDKTVKLWDLNADRELRDFGGHTGHVTSLAVTAHGQHVASASVDGTIRMWNLESGEETGCISAHTDKVSTVCLLSDGRALSGSRDGKLRLWDLASGEKLKSFPARGRVTTAAITPDGRWALAGLSDGTLKLWNVDTGEEVRTMAGHTDRVGSVVITADGRRAISASWDCTLRIWDLATGLELCCLTGHTDRVSSVAVGPDGSVAVSFSDDGTIKLWDLNRARGSAIRPGHTDVITAIAANPRRTQVLSAARDGAVRIWDAESLTELRCLRGQGRELSSIVATLDGARAICGFRDRTVELWDLDSGGVLRSFVGHRGEVAAVAVTADGRALSASEDRTVRVWDVDSGAELRQFVPHTRSVTAMAVGKGKVLSGAWDSGSWDGALKIWDLETGEVICSFSGLADSVSSVAVTHDFTRGVCGCWDGTAKVWDLRRSSEVLSYTEHEDTITAMIMTPDGRLAASASQDQTLHVWETATGKVLAKFTGDGPLTACAVVGRDPTFIVGEASGAIHFLRLEAHASEAVGVAAGSGHEPAPR
jgi:WD40 repeat protein